VGELGPAQEKTTRMGVAGRFKRHLGACPLHQPHRSRFRDQTTQIRLSNGAIDVEAIDPMGHRAEFKALGQHQAGVAHQRGEPLDLLKEAGIMNQQIVFEVAVQVVGLSQSVSEHPLGLKPQQPAVGRLGHHFLVTILIGRFKLIEHVVLAIGDNLHLDGVAVALVGGIHSPIGHVQHRLGQTQPPQAQQLLLQGLDSGLGISPQRLMPTTATGVPVMNDRQQDAHRPILPGRWRSRKPWAAIFRTGAPAARPPQSR